MESKTSSSGVAEIAGFLARGLLRYFQDQGAVAVTELTLATGRRADVVALDPKGQITIVEVKSGPADFRADIKWREYRDYCDRFYFAVAEDFPRDILPDECGVLIADGYGAHELRESDLVPLAAARRKAVTLLFARTAARRLKTFTDPL